ncbi:carboxypeptidase-like regulatory domain-containing protein [Croceivirga thetidis]|uniref:Carboxypeptidase regulatory-like domain-containing protein n=1 Tax=Croceivirga thetidis TaxID=2721623 RepID=A0ABX1GWM4_9FLAO|nr:carboxypeptidase-like regulatory domain-containing protein [Croceivirga thetidis]NKI33117.1 carboxypeptidase regulatory-like domain-containing protein [Croceivirga thetidis]
MLRQTILVVVVLSCFSCLAQHKVTGTIVDELGLPVNKAKITMEDSPTEIFTDYQGSFSISSETDFYWKIKISCEGFLTETYYVLDGGNAGNITLAYDIDLNKLLEDGNGLNLNRRFDFEEKGQLAFSYLKNDLLNFSLRL